VSLAVQFVDRSWNYVRHLPIQGKYGFVTSIDLARIEDTQTGFWVRYGRDKLVPPQLDQHLNTAWRDELVSSAF